MPAYIANNPIIEFFYDWQTLDELLPIIEANFRKWNQRQSAIGAGGPLLPGAEKYAEPLRRYLPLLGSPFSTMFVKLDAELAALAGPSFGPNTQTYAALFASVRDLIHGLQEMAKKIAADDPIRSQSESITGHSNPVFTQTQCRNSLSGVL